MIKRHLKRLSAPRSWKIKRKGITFITRPKPGTHSYEFGLPITVVLKELNYATTTREVKKILINKIILVDGVRRQDHRFMVGLMDTLSIPELKAYYRFSVNAKEELTIIKVDEKETKVKPCKITGKSLVKDKVQLNLFDSRNILVEKKTDYKIGDTILIEIPSQKILQHLKLERNALVLVIKGKKVGSIGTVENISQLGIACKKDNGEIIETLKKYVFVIGKEKPVVKLEQ